MGEAGNMIWGKNVRIQAVNLRGLYGLPMHNWRWRAHIWLQGQQGAQQTGSANAKILEYRVRIKWMCPLNLHWNISEYLCGDSLGKVASGFKPP